MSSVLITPLRREATYAPARFGNFKQSAIPVRAAASLRSRALARYGEALTEFEKLRANQCFACRAYAHAMLGERSETLSDAERTAGSTKTAAHSDLFLGHHVGLKEKDQAFAWLDNTLEERDFLALSMAC
jgi:hypothetical protein